MRLKKNNKYLRITAGGRFLWVDDILEATEFSKKEAQLHSKAGYGEIVTTIVTHP